MEEKVYDATKPKMTQIIDEGIKAFGSLEKKATPFGKDNTPAPMILLAKLKVDVDIEESPPTMCPPGLLLTKTDGCV